MTTTTRAFNPDKTPLTDWLAAHIGWAGAFLILLAVCLAAAALLVHCWRRTGERLDEALDAEYEQVPEHWRQESATVQQVEAYLADEATKPYDWKEKGL